MRLLPLTLNVEVVNPVDIIIIVIKNNYPSKNKVLITLPFGVIKYFFSET